MTAQKPPDRVSGETTRVVAPAKKRLPRKALPPADESEGLGFSLYKLLFKLAKIKPFESSSGSGYCLLPFYEAEHQGGREEAPWAQASR
ncbi:Alpha-Protein Kinase 3 [Manis pentadactyla]|nr:Alpha-Protein Kinase 3 [Manis pentadactyla]